MRGSHQRSLVKPDVRNYRIRLSDDPSAIGIRKELTTLSSQVDKPLGQSFAWRTILNEVKDLDQVDKI
jgi:hypothetical protein